MPQDRAREDLTELQERLYQLLAEIAAAGEVCPTNRALSEACGVSAASTIADAMGRLRRKGLLSVVSYGRRGRVVTLTELDLTTAAPKVRQGRRDRGPSRSRRHEAAYEVSAPGREAEEFESKGNTWVPPWCEADLRAALPARRDQSCLRAAAVRVWRPPHCQYIPDVPHPDDSCKCGEAVVVGTSYCATHLKRCALQASALKSVSANAGFPAAQTAESVEG